MKIIAVGTLRDFWKKHPDSEQSLRAWHDEAKAAQWHTPADLKKQFASASIVGNNRVVFNMKGNAYRLIVAIAYKTGVIFIKFIGTHAEYDQVDAAKVEHP